MQTMPRRGPRARVPAALLGLFVGLLLVLAAAPPAGAASGKFAWDRVYDGAAGGYDGYSAAVAAPSGGVYVAGTTAATAGHQSLLIARYGAGGGLDWRRVRSDMLGADSMAAEPGGGLVVGGTAFDPDEVAALARYSAAGTRLWLRLYSESGALSTSDGPVAVDRAGNVYMAGSFIKSSSYAILLLKYSAAGKLRWARHYTTSGSDSVSGIALDRAGDVYLTSAASNGTNNDVLTLKYSAAGKRRWVRFWDGPGDGDDAGMAIAVSAAGTAYVVGWATGGSSGQDAVVIKYSSGGALRWARFQSGPGAFDDTYFGVTLAANGDVVATGREHSSTTGDDVLTVRLTPAGVTRWARLYNGPDNLDDVGTVAAVAATGAVYVEAASSGATTNTDWLTLKYSAGGKRDWAQRYTSTGNAIDYPNALVVRKTGVYAAGNKAGAGTSDAALVKYEP